MVQALLAFLLAAGLLTITPGLDTALVLRTAAAGGARPAAFAALGISLGCLVWGAATAVGLAALLAASTLAFTGLRIAGAIYLMYLGAKLLLRPRRTLDLGAVAGVPASPWAAMRTGLLTNLLNPKIGVFYVTFLPQFVPHGVDVGTFTFLLAVIHAGVGLAWFAVLIAATAPLSRALRRPGVVTWLDRVTGGVFVLFGLRLALSRA